MAVADPLDQDANEKLTPAMRMFEPGSKITPKGGVQYRDTRSIGTVICVLRREEALLPFRAVFTDH